MQQRQARDRILWQGQRAENHCCWRNYEQSQMRPSSIHSLLEWYLMGTGTAETAKTNWQFSFIPMCFLYLVWISGNSAIVHFWWKKSTGFNNRRYMNPILSSGREGSERMRKKNLIICIIWHRLFKEFGNQLFLFPNYSKLCRLQWKIPKNQVAERWITHTGKKKHKVRSYQHLFF